MKTEICTGNIATIEFAATLNVDRIELCAALALGGLTPSYGLIKASAALKGIETHVMIRPNAGPFVVNKNDLQIMKADIEVSAKLGAKGVVFGCLNADGTLAIENTRELCVLAHSLGLVVTFHRAFDFIIKPFEALEQLIALKVNRLLTSGQEKTAKAGLDLIQTLVNKADGRIEIMAGSGVNAQQVNVFKTIKVNAIHFSGDKSLVMDNIMGMGNALTTDRDKIHAILNEI